MGDLVRNPCRRCRVNVSRQLLPSARSFYCAEPRGTCAREAADVFVSTRLLVFDPRADHAVTMIRGRERPSAKNPETRNSRDMQHVSLFL